MIHDNAENKSESLSMLIQNVSLLFQKNNKVSVSPGHTPPRRNSSDTESIGSFGSGDSINTITQLQKEVNALREDNTYRYRA